MRLTYRIFLFLLLFCCFSSAFAQEETPKDSTQIYRKIETYSEKRKFTSQQEQIQNIKKVLFPKDGLQERKENFSSFYAKWGRVFIEELYNNSLGLEQEFIVLLERN